ncbi:hypothetical protein HU200_060831 [Digitaria exilis]|uniref:F-box domain-containing protein n=1 Tax=Digitaria exilis TaxID=1010633 RepID=A0A835AFX1_9POAL|nr:hypothetical protein HU200_060831 [Digitaria exilis]
MDGWLSWRRRGQSPEDTDGTPLPDDVLAAVFARLTDAADVLRCAATYRQWCRVVAKDAAVHARFLPPEQRAAEPSSASSPYSLIPASAAAYWLFGFRSPYPIPLSDGGHHSALLEQSRPVAARNGWVVLGKPCSRESCGKPRPLRVQPHDRTDFYAPLPLRRGQTKMLRLRATHRRRCRRTVAYLHHRLLQRAHRLQPLPLHRIPHLLIRHQPMGHGNRKINAP